MFRLAGYLQKTPDEIERMPSEQFYHWMVLEKIEPFGEYGEWLRNGILASILANSNRGKNQKAFKPEDFMPRFHATPAQTPEQLRAAFLVIKAAQDAHLRAKAKREKLNADAARNRTVRKQAQRSRVNRQAKGAR